MLVALAGACLLLTISLALSTFGSVWSEYDFRALDFFFRRAVAHGFGPKQSPQIVLVTITDATYNSLGRTSLDRGYMADVNDALSSLDIEALGYDLIFSRAGDADSDARFERSLRRMGSVYLPIGLGFSENASSFRWEDGQSFKRLRSEYIRKPVEAGTGKPFYATRALMQCDIFSEASRSSGHISALSDSDGVYRHMIMLLKVGDACFPTLSLSMFLDYARVPFEKVLVEWGRRIVIPAGGESFLEKDVVIPIDERGCAYVPFPGEWDRTFKKMEVSSLLQRMDDRNLRGNLTDFFEGRFILLGDVSTGSADLGHTPLESDTPLILLHASMLNGMLTNEFYAK
ncbi:MAG: CHASE2 domain-containing protein, partial [Syntrophobacteraceae bacterium]